MMTLETQRAFENSPLWKLKTRLQFSGWLQYVIHAVLICIVVIIAGVGWLIGYWPLVLFWVPLGLAALLSISLVGTILLVKYGMHPAERIPVSKADLGEFDLMRTRRSCRSFQSRHLMVEHHAALLEAAALYSQQDQLLGHQPIRFEYIDAPLVVWPVVGAREFLVAIAPREYSRLSIIDVGRSLQRIVLQATRMGLATCWIGPGADQKSTVELLGDRFDPTKDHGICVCAIGYESKFKPLVIRLMERLQHQRLPLSQLFFSEPACQVALKTEAAPFREYGHCYEACQWSPSSFNGQTTRCAAITARVGDDDKLLRFDFFAATASRYYAPVALGIWCANWEAGCAELDIGGHFEQLSSEVREDEDMSQLPRYDISWVVG
jgi:nitroreductase